ncbi:olfactory receptor 2A12-like [Eucyclogobius newberryi]|uniref:olfactory receptor 2A12-like n=1 Tax=Eucyclogobius newberryi TaxID=166745 RepID=UPI003B595185
MYLGLRTPAMSWSEPGPGPAEEQVGARPWSCRGAGPSPALVLPRCRSEPGPGPAEEQVRARPWSCRGAGPSPALVLPRSRSEPGPGPAEVQVQARPWSCRGAGPSPALVLPKTGSKPGPGPAEEQVRARPWSCRGAGPSPALVLARCRSEPGPGPGEVQDGARPWSCRGAGPSPALVLPRSRSEPGPGPAEEQVRARPWSCRGAGPSPALVLPRSRSEPGPGPGEVQMENPENLTMALDVLLLEGLPLPPRSALPTFVVLLLLYIFILVSNVSLMLLICVQRPLRTPMYLLFCNMSLNDMFGASTVIPRLLQDLLAPQDTRYITYGLCVLQAFCAHFHASTVHTVLMAMAFDRYVAIVYPLRYSLIMTGRMVLSLSLAAWGVCFLMVLVLILLSVRLSRCRSVVSNPFCDNASLFKLSCDSVLVNNVYGLFYTVVLLSSSVGSVAITYVRIVVVCLSRRSGSLNRRALQTCASHLASYLLMLVSGSIIVILHRFPALAERRKMASILFHVVPPALNVLIYGLQIREVRDRIMLLCIRRQRAVKPP